MKYHIEIEGIRPLLQNRFPEESFEAEAKTKRNVGTIKGDVPETKLYKLPDGTIYEPAEHILGTLIKAATNFKVGGKRGKSYKDLIQSSVIITPDTIPHIHQEWIVDKRSVVVPATRGRVMRLRPRFDKWALKFSLEIVEDRIGKATIKEILDFAGTSVGIGDYRPRFGGFIVTHFMEE
jgi:hypothetical protein